MRVAVVGLGEAGSTIHLPALAGLSSATLVGAADLDASRRDRAARFRVPVFADLDEMLARARPEVVVAATPPALHVDHCRTALAAGAHGVCEKPFSPDSAGAELVLRSAAAAGRRVAVNHEFRQMPILQALLAEAQRSSGPSFAQL